MLIPKAILQKLILIHFLILITVNTSYSQAVDTVSKTDNFYKTDSIFSFRSPKGYFPSLAHNFGEQITSPFRFSKKDWLLTGAAAGITASLLFLDDEIDSWATVQKDKNQFLEKVSPVFTEFGDIYGYCVVGAIGTFSAVFNKQKGVQTSLLASQAVITSGVWVQVIKLLTGRERPKGAYLYSLNPSGDWNGPFSRFEKQGEYNKSVFAYDAFPSGHTAVAFSIATVFATQYSDLKAVPLICYSTASLIGISRMIEHEHWASDVFAGAVIGYLSGKQVTRYFNRTHPKINGLQFSEPGPKAQFTIVQYGNQLGFAVRW